VAEINNAMTQVDRVTQLNASTAEEMAATSEEIASQMAALQELMAFFHLDRREEAAGSRHGISTTAVSRGTAAAARPGRRTAAAGPAAGGVSSAAAAGRTEPKDGGRGERDFERFQEASIP
jgi:methyl-accepting chemotaxis protein